MGFVEEDVKGESTFARGGEEGVDEIEDSRKVLFDFVLRAKRHGGRRVEEIFFDFPFEDAADGLARDADGGCRVLTVIRGCIIDITGEIVVVFEVVVVFANAAILLLHPPNFLVDVALSDDFLFRRSCRN